MRSKDYVLPVDSERQEGLFRAEAMASRARRLEGDLHLATPVSWQAIGFLAFGSLLALFALLASSTYARTETVAGAIVVDKGVAAIVPSRAGVVSAVRVVNGTKVRAGEVLVAIRSEETLSEGGTAPSRTLASLTEQDRLLGEQAVLLTTAAAAEQAKLDSQALGGRREMTELKAQITEQRRLVAVAEADYARATGVAERGFISRQDLEAREFSMIQRRQQLSQLQQQLQSRSTDVLSARAAQMQVLAQARAQAQALGSSRAEIGQQMAQAKAAQGYALISPVSGTATAVVVRVGQPVAAGQALLMVAPADGRLRAELYVPTTAAGFVAAGQTVRLSVDAFPYQRFGSIEGRIVEASTIAVPKAAATGETVPVYIVTAELPQNWVFAFGNRQPLLPGMTLSARIVTRRQTLVEWLLEPLFAIARR